MQRKDAMRISATDSGPAAPEAPLAAAAIAFAGIEAERGGAIANFYARHYEQPRLREVTGCADHLEFYLAQFAGRLQSGGGALVSIGSGDAALELQIAHGLRRLGIEDFSFDCVEPSPECNARARQSVQQAGLGEMFRFLECDGSAWRPERPYRGVMTREILHRVTHLEELFAAIREAIAPGGVFATVDAVGRDGHQVWPETRAIIEKLWAILPPERRRHRLKEIVVERFPDPARSEPSPDGIRAQEILRLLVRHFGFEAFVAFGGLTDVFTDPAWGNGDAHHADDLAFIDLVHFLNDLLIDLGHIKPTRIVAAMSLDRASKPRLHRHWTPQFCLPPAGEATSAPAPARAVKLEPVTVMPPIMIGGMTLSPRQYRGLFRDLTAALPDAKAAAQHYAEHGRQEIAEGRRKPRPEQLLELELQQLSPLAPAEFRSPNWRYFPGTNGTLNLVFSDNAADGAFTPPAPETRPADSDARLYLKDDSDSFHQHGIPGLTDSIGATARWLEQAIARIGPTRVRTVGLGSGGYAAVLYGHLLGADAIHAVAPELVLGLPQYRSARFIKERRHDPNFRDLRPLLPALNPRLSVVFPAYEPVGYRMLQLCRAGGLEHLALTADFHPGGHGAPVGRVFGAAAALVPPAMMVVRQYPMRDAEEIERIAVAHEALIERDYARSGALLRDAVAADPGNAGLRCHVGVHRFLEGDTSRAEEVVRAALQEIAAAQGGGRSGRLVASAAKQIVPDYYDRPRKQARALEAMFDRALLAALPE